ncbi:hypothetical protein ACOSQ2_016427 [Xanthoceras sorbifolium]
MSRKKCDDAECCERNVIYDIVFLEDRFEFEYDGGDGDLDEYFLSIIDNNSKEESRQELLNTNVDKLENLETGHEKLQKKVKVKKTKSKLVEDLFLEDFLVLSLAIFMFFLANFPLLTNNNETLLRSIKDNEIDSIRIRYSYN